MPDNSIIPIKGDERHGEGGDDPEAGVEEPTGDAEVLAKHPSAILTEQHDEGERQAEHGGEEVGQREGHDECIGDRPELPVFDDHNHHSRVSQAGEQKYGQEQESLSGHGYSLQH